MLKDSNPQGKGLVPIMENLLAVRSLISIPPKDINQISNELFTSVFILNSEFKFKPITGKKYWLYFKADRFRLSLIPPGEWGDNRFGLYIGECVLQLDITWTLELDQKINDNFEIIGLIERKKKDFEQSLAIVDSFDDILPVFDESLPFYQRAFASGLAHSLNVSMRKSGIAGLSYREALIKNDLLIE